MKKVLFILVIGLLIFTHATAFEIGTVNRVVDGDTLKVMVNDEELTVRMLGVDTPESVKSGTPVQAGSLEASDYTKQLTGKKVLLVYDKKRLDFYGRVLAYVWVEHPEGKGLVCWNLQLIKEGYGILYLKYKFDKSAWFLEELAAEIQ